MPIYEYNCKQCGENFEHLLRTADEEVACPACSSTNIHRLLSTFSAHAAGNRPACGLSEPCRNETDCKSGCCRFAQG